MFDASIVTFLTDPVELVNAIATLQSAGAAEVYVIDNSPTRDLESLCDRPGVTYIFPGENLGYGRAHNIALSKSIEKNIDYHLVINSDVTFETSIIKKITTKMDSDPSIGQLIPKVLNPDGTLQASVRLLPTPLDLFGRRFLPKKWFAWRNARYTLARRNPDRELNVPYHQGSFMFLRVEALCKVGLFDERFFMYPEDIDLTRRIHEHYRTLYWPEVRVIHQHRAASYKSLKMLWIHSVNMIKYFNKWGWFIDTKRRRANRATLNSISK